jgi:hypothetical protein
MLSKLVTDVIKSAGGPPASGSDPAVLEGLAVTRECLETNVTVDLVDAWEGLAKLQLPRPVTASEVEKTEDEAADNRQDVVNAQF